MLTREEINERLAFLGEYSLPSDKHEREALQTALAAMDEWDEEAEAHRILRNMYHDVLAEGRLLAQWLACPPRNTSETANWHYPNIAAEVERVRRLEAVLDAAEALIDSRGAHIEGSVPLKNAIAAYRNGERPGGESDAS